jgi:hypothetical protein
LQRNPPPEVEIAVCYFSPEDGCWLELPEAEFLRLRELATTVGSVDATDWRDAIVAFEVALAEQPPASFPVGTFLINLGAPWDFPDYFLALRSVIDQLSFDLCSLGVRPDPARHSGKLYFRAGASLRWMAWKPVRSY